MQKVAAGGQKKKAPNKRITPVFQAVAASNQGRVCAHVDEGICTRCVKHSTFSNTRFFSPLHENVSRGTVYGTRLADRS